MGQRVGYGMSYLFHRLTALSSKQVQMQDLSPIVIE